MLTFKSWLAQQGLGEREATIVATAAAFAAVLLLSFVAYAITRRVLLRLVEAAARRSTTTWDDALVDAGVFSRLSHLVPAVILYATAPLVYGDLPQVIPVIQTLTFDAGVFSRLSHLVPAVILYATAPLVYGDLPQVIPVIQTLTFVYMALVGLNGLRRVVERRFDHLRHVPHRR